MYLTLYPNMDKKNFMSFSDFKIQLIPVNKKNLSSEDEVLTDVQEIRKKLERR